MACSPAQLESNRKNAARSTGPKTPEGRKKSSRNSLKHGLTGEGIVLPDEDVEEIDELFEALEAEMKPRSILARAALRRAAFLNVRLDRSARNEAKAISERMRAAKAKFDDARLAEVEKLISWIAAEPVTNARRLRATPEGIDCLIVAMEKLNSDLSHPGGMRWTWVHCDTLHNLLGLRGIDVPVSRPQSLSEAIKGNFEFLNPGDGEGLDKHHRQLWALGTLANLIEDEILKLKKLRQGLDLQGLELDRSEAATRAIFDPSKDAVLARKYEAATERGLYRALKEFRELQAEAPEVQVIPTLTAEPSIELGSSLPEPPVEHDEVADVDATVLVATEPPSEGEDRDSLNDEVGAIMPAGTVVKDPGTSPSA